MLPRLAAVATYLITAISFAGQLTNPDFESKGGWQLPATAQDLCGIIDDDGRSGQHSLRFKVDEPAVLPPVTQILACRPNHEYVLTAAFKCAGDMKPIVSVSVGGNERMVNVRITAGAEAAWHAKSARFNSGPHDKLLVTIHASSDAARGNPAGPGVAWVDDVDVLSSEDVPVGAQIAGGYTGKPIGKNIALGKTYTFNKKSEYKYCADEGDARQLTDGQYSVGYFWVQKSTVGWRHGSPVIITFDLGQVEPVAGVSFSTAAGTAGVAWPTCIFILTSEDGKTWRSAGELLELSGEHGIPRADRYSAHRFVTGQLATKGRYVRLAIKSAGAYTFCDEVEIYRGPDELLGRPMAGAPVDDVKELLLQSPTIAGIRYRMRKDLADMRQVTREAKLDRGAKAQLLGRLEGLQKRVADFKPVVTEDFRATIPLNDLHAEVLSTNAVVLSAKGLDGLVLWHKNRWDMLLPTEAPPVTRPHVQMHVQMMDNEYRAEVVNITNATDRPATATVSIRGLPSGANPDHVTVHQVEFVDTQEKIVIADALVPIDQLGGRVTLPAGVTRQLWLRFHPQGLKPGIHEGKLEIDAGDRGVHAVPLKLQLYPFRFPDQPTCSLGLWDYTDGQGARDIKPGNRLAAIANMKAHFVDTPWAGPSTAPRVTPADLDAQGNLKKALDFARFDQWVADWEGARNYYVFINVRDYFAGTKRGTSRFDNAVSAWAAAWAKHCAELGLKPKQLGVLILDEPHSDLADQRILDWAMAIKQGTPDITIWEDPVHHAPWSSGVPHMFEICDVLCPNVPRYLKGGERAKQFYGDLCAKGAKLWFYQCSGPGRLHDPYYYHRLQHWHCWNANAVGSGFWAYGDAAGTSPWNDYAAKRTSYSPVYLDKDGVTDGKHFEGVREGIEDYEYLRMLRDRLAELAQINARGPLFEQATKLLEDLPRQVATYDAGRMPWVREKDRTAADLARVQILEALASLVPEPR